MHEYTGNTLEEAIENAMNALNVNRDFMDVEIIEEKKSFFARNRWVKIRVYVNEEEGDRKKKPRVITPLSPPADELVAETDFEHGMLNFIRGIMQRLQISAAVYLVKRVEEDLYIEIDTTDAPLLIGKHGGVFDGLQTLIFSVARNLGNEKRVLIDVEGYRKKREQRLAAMAKRTYAEVQKNGKSVLLKPMSPAERLIIHRTIQSFGGDVSTKSTGSEKNYIRQIKIFIDK